MKSLMAMVASYKDVSSIANLICRQGKSDYYLATVLKQLQLRYP